jgi:Bacterial RNA polymerase, alpha chain C terminal domain
MPMAPPAPRQEGSEAGMDDDDKKIAEELFARIAAIEERIREIRTTLLAPLEDELHDLASGSARRKLAHLVLVKFPAMSLANPSQARDMEIRTVKRELLDTMIDDLELSVRSANCLYRVREKPILRVGDLIMFTERELLRHKNFGRKSLREVNEILRSMGLSLGAVHVDWEPSPGSAKPGDI